MISQISFSKYPVLIITCFFACTSSIGNLRSIGLEFNILSPFPYVYFPIENILLSKPLQIFMLATPLCYFHLCQAEYCGLIILV